MSETSERGISACAVHKEIHYVVLAFLIERLTTPRALNELARQLYDGVQQHASHEGLLERLAELAYKCVQDAAARNACDTDDAQAGAEPNDMTAQAIMKLAPTIERALNLLPAMHCSVLVAHARDRMPYEQIASRFDLHVDAVATYASQARALVRTFACEPENEDARLTVLSREELLGAQRAADWLYRVRSAACEPEFGRWLTCSPVHTREWLLVIAWDAVLCRSAPAENGGSARYAVIPR